MEIKFIPIDYDYFDFQGKNYIRLVGRDEIGRRVCVIDSYEPNFWVIFESGTTAEKIKKIEEKIKKLNIQKGSRESKVLKTDLQNKNFLGKKVKALQIFVSNHKDAHDLASEIGDVKEIVARREYDLPIITKYIKEKKIEPLKFYEVKGRDLDVRDFGGIADNFDVDICIEAEEFSQLKEEKKFEPKVLAYDIETSDLELGKGEILMISLYGENFKKVLTWKHCKKKQDFVECFSDEADMIEAFVNYVRDFSPDILAGYFSDGFDLHYLKSAATKNKIPLALGLDGKGPKFTKGILPSAKIAGIVHVDLYKFVSSIYSQYLQSETLSLNDVASELLGSKKLEFNFTKLFNMKDEDWRDFFEYNLKDSELAYQLFKKVWLDILEFSKIVKEPIYDITRDRMSSHVENYLLHHLDRFNEIAEKRPTHSDVAERKSRGKYEGAFVFQPIPGMYEKLAMFDFTSMYASVIVSYNLSLSTIKKISDKGKKVEFQKEKGFFPELLEEVIRLRKKYKEEYSKDKDSMARARSNAYKLLANAAYGYQGFFGARYYCLEAAAATASFARDNIHSAIQKIEKEGYKIIYSDTDSIAFLLGEKNESDALNLLKKINSELPGIMELELEDFYKRGLFVSKRTTEAGAKKKYALIDEKGNLKIRGFETVRRDWCTLSRRLQSRVIKSVLENGNEKKALVIVQEIVRELNNREVELQDLMIRTQLKKPLNEYLAEGPHVIAAKKMEAQGLPVSQGMLIEYYLAENNSKSKLIRDKVKLPDERGEYDIEYYLNNQIIPSIETIFEVFDVNIKETIEGKKQMSLGDFK